MGAGWGRGFCECQGAGRQSFLCQGGLLLGPAPQEAPNEIIHMPASQWH